MTDNINSFLIIDDDKDFTSLLCRGLTREGIQVECAHSVKDAKQLLSEKPFSHASIDLNMGGESGLELVSYINEYYPNIQTVVLTGYASISTAVEAIKKGATQYLAKPINAQDVITIFNQENDQVSIDKTIQSDLALAEWEKIQTVLKECDFNISEAARQLGMHRRTLQRKLKKRQFF